MTHVCLCFFKKNHVALWAWPKQVGPTPRLLNSFNILILVVPGCSPVGQPCDSVPHYTALGCSNWTPESCSVQGQSFRLWAPRISPSKCLRFPELPISLVTQRNLFPKHEGCVLSVGSPSSPGERKGRVIQILWILEDLHSSLFPTRKLTAGGSARTTFLLFRLTQNHWFLVSF